MVLSAALLNPAARTSAGREFSLLSIDTSGLSAPYLWAAALGFSLCGFLGLWMSYRLALRFAAPPAAQLATAAVWLASSLPVYLYVVPFDTQVIAMFSSAFFLTQWVSVREGQDTRARWALWGFAGGLAIVSSFFNAALLIAAFAEWVTRLVRRRSLVDALANGALFVAGASVVLAPALFIRRQVDGGWLIDGHFPVMHWSAPRLGEIAVSAQDGAFLWTPILAIAALGLFIAVRRQPALGGVLLAAAATSFYLVAAAPATTGPSYGARLLLPLIPAFICGLAALADAAAVDRGKTAWMAAAGAAALFVLWNGGLMLQWGTGVIPQNGPLDVRAAAANQVNIVPRAARNFVIRYIHERKALVSGLGHGTRE
jgi:hypothetical protein